MNCAGRLSSVAEPDDEATVEGVSTRPRNQLWRYVRAESNNAAQGRRRATSALAQRRVQSVTNSLATGPHALTVSAM